MITPLPLMRCDVTRDGEQCDTEWVSPIGPATARALRAYLAGCGWHHTRSGDICPDCWTDGSRPAPTSRQPAQGGNQTTETP